MRCNTDGSLKGKTVSGDFETVVHKGEELDVVDAYDTEKGICLILKKVVDDLSFYVHVPLEDTTPLI